jgi:hypothetical protein
MFFKDLFVGKKHKPYRTAIVDVVMGAVVVGLLLLLHSSSSPEQSAHSRGSGWDSDSPAQRLRPVNIVR